MVLETLGAAWAYAATAYGYNMNRFKFDAGQEMSRAYQLMSVRMAQWNLFRQDVRDLFDLTISNLSKYQVVSTFFLGYCITYLYSCMPAFPSEPRWMMVIWGNCAVSSTMYGVLSIWLSIHGCIAAHSANVKMLTQVVRPPIPSAAEVDAVRTSVSTYEGGGVARMLKPPEFLGGGGGGGRGPPAPPPAGSAAAGANSGVSGDRSFRSAMSDLSFSRTSSPTSPPASSQHLGGGGAGGGGEHAAVVEARSKVALTDLDGGPGDSAAFQGHIRLFRHMHITYACFSAYAFIGMAACVYDMLLTAAYLCVAHKLIKADDEGRRMQNSFFSWSVVLIVAFTSLVLFKLDLYVEGKKLRVFKQAVIASPLLTCSAAHLWAAQQMKGQTTVVPQILAMFACLLHLLWSCLFRWEARPVACQGKLPTSFRSVRYLDVFGWLDDEDAQAGRPVGSEDAAASSSAAAPGSGGMQRFATSSSASGPLRESSELGPVIVLAAEEQGHDLLRAIESLLEQQGYLPMDDSSILHGLGEDLRRSLEVLNEARAASRSFGAEASASSPSGTWLRCLHADAAGLDATAYFVSALTGEVCLEAPQFRQVLDLPAIRASVEVLQRRLPQEPPALFLPMARRPGSSHDAASMPWKYFAQASFASTCLWVVSILYIGLAELLPRSPTAAAAKTLASAEGSAASWLQQTSRVQASWPHAFFRPSALACAGGDLVVSDRYMVHAAQMPLAWPPTELPEPPVEHAAAARPRLRLQPLRLANLSAPWRSLGAAGGDSSSSSAGGPGRCASVFRLEADGRAVVEHPVPSKGCNSTAPPRRWVLGARLRSALHAIQAVTGAAAVEPCRQAHKRSSPAEVRWALYGASEQGEVVLLCPEENGSTLEPRFVVAGPFSLRDTSASVAPGAAEVLGLWYDLVGRSVWLLSRSSAGSGAGQTQTLLRSWAAPGGALLGAWQLPAGRRWAPGLCGLGGGQGFLAAAAPEAPGAGPEIWRLRPSMATCAGAGNEGDLLVDGGGRP